MLTGDHFRRRRPKGESAPASTRRVGGMYSAAWTSPPSGRNAPLPGRSIDLPPVRPTGRPPLPPPDCPTARPFAPDTLRHLGRRPGGILGVLPASWWQPERAPNLSPRLGRQTGNTPRTNTHHFVFGVLVGIPGGLPGGLAGRIPGTSQEYSESILRMVPLILLSRTARGKRTMPVRFCVHTLPIVKST